MEPLLRTVDLCKYYGQGENEVKAVQHANLEIQKGEFAAIVGKSGSGKSTLLHMLGGLDTPTKGKVLIRGKDIFSYKDDALAVFRRRKIGFIFQSFNLVSSINVWENIVLPMGLDGRKADEKFVMDIVKLDSSATGGEILKNNMWQFFDENFKNSHTKTGQVYVKLTDGTGKQMTCTYVIDAKGNPLIYRCPGLFNTSSFDLGSAGEDGCLGDGGVQINSNKEIEAITASEYEKFGQGDDIVNFTNNLQ